MTHSVTSQKISEITKIQGKSKRALANNTTYEAREQGDIVFFKS